MIFVHFEGMVSAKPAHDKRYRQIRYPINIRDICWFADFLLLRTSDKGYYSEKYKEFILSVRLH